MSHRGYFVAEVLLSVQNLVTTFPTKMGPVHAVNDLSYNIHKGEILGIVGESGCGKSVTSYSIMGLLQKPGYISSGKIYFQGEDLVNASEEHLQDLRGHKMAMIFQEPMTALNPVLTIGKQMDEQIIKHLNFNQSQSKKRAIEMLELVGIPAPEERYHSYPHQLSGGMRQRAMIAMALSCEPDFLIADEPTTALDVTIQAQILELMQSLQKKFGMTIQFITHDLGVISELSDRVIVMYAGRPCEIAKTSDIFKNPQHPYTKSLINSIPKIGRNLKRLPTIEGSVPSPFELPKGCAFQNRCAHSTDKCQQVPQMTEVSPSHFVACHHPTKGEEH